MKALHNRRGVETGGEGPPRPSRRRPLPPPHRHPTRPPDAPRKDGGEADRGRDLTAQDGGREDHERVHEDDARGRDHAVVVDIPVQARGRGRGAGNGEESGRTRAEFRRDCRRETN